MRQAIETKYLGPTNFRGSRVRATCAGGSMTIAYRDEFSPDYNHYLAAIKLAYKLNWSEVKKDTIKGGQLKNGNYVWVLL